MPIFEFTCQDCGTDSELLVSGNDYQATCSECGGVNLKKKLSVPSSLSGVGKSSNSLADSGACCGMSPGEAGCPGPGSCCGHQVSA